MLTFFAVFFAISLLPYILIKRFWTAWFAANFLTQITFWLMIYKDSILAGQVPRLRVADVVFWFPLFVFPMCIAVFWIATIAALPVILARKIRENFAAKMPDTKMNLHPLINESANKDSNPYKTPSV